MSGRGPGLHNQDAWRGFLRIGGGVAVVIGGLLTVMALGDFFASMGTFQPPRYFWMAFAGLPLLAIGGAMLQAGFAGPATRYMAGEVTPAIRDTLDALGIGAGARRCPACGDENDANARFCDGCGAALQRDCASCGTVNAPDARFCDGCGAALSDP